jgi:hypothetical protein
MRPENEPARGAVSRGQRARGRGALLGYSLLFLGIAAVNFAGFRPLRWLGAATVIVGAVLVGLGPREARGALTPRNIRRIACIAAVPETGAVIVVYSAMIAAFTGAVTILVSTI